MMFKTFLFSIFLFNSFLFFAQPFQNSLLFDGLTSYVIVPASPVLDQQTELTIEAWINPCELSGYRGIVNKQWCGNSDPSYHFNIRDGYIDFVWNLNSNCSDYNHYQSTIPIVQVNVWQHVAVVFTSTEVKIYYNGSLVNGNLLTGNYTPIRVSSEPLRIGMYKNLSGGFSGFFKGEMDEIRIWNTNVSSADISSRYLNSLSGNEPNLVAYYDMNESGSGSGILVSNSSLTNGSALDGLTNGTSAYPSFESINFNVFLGSDTVLCLGNTLHLDATTTGASYSWSDNSTSSTFDVVSPGIYWVDVTRSCLIIRDSILVSFSSSFQLTCSPDTLICSGGAADLQAVGANQYSWSPVASLSNSMINNPFASPTASTMYYVEGIDNNGCIANDSVLVTVKVWDNFLIQSDTMICENGTATINQLSLLGAGFVETWNQGLVGNAPHIVSPLVNTCYDVFVTDAIGCVSPTKSICVTLSAPLLIATSGDLTICPKSDNIVEVTQVSGGSGVYSYEWQYGTAIISDSSEAVIAIDSLGQYCVTVSDDCETSPVLECVIIDYYNKPNLAFSSDKIDGCAPLEVSFLYGGDQSLITAANWGFGNGESSSDLNGSSVIYSGENCFDVTLSLTTTDGCIFDTLIGDYICLFPSPNADFNIEPSIISTTSNEISLENESSNDVLFFDWEIGILGSPTSSSLENLIVDINSSVPQKYPIELIVTNSYGCSDTVIRFLTIVSDFSMYIPNSFSPNGDGINDLFFVEGQSIPSEGFLLMIFDRDGKVLFESTDINEAWNGNSKTGVPVPIGVYVWKLLFKKSDQRDLKELFGHVTVYK